MNLLNKLNIYLWQYFYIFLTYNVQQFSLQSTMFYRLDAPDLPHNTGIIVEPITKQ